MSQRCSEEECDNQLITAVVQTLDSTIHYHHDPADTNWGIQLRYQLDRGLSIQGSYRFLNKKFKDFSRTFRDTFSIFQGLHSVQKRALSLCLFWFFHNTSNFIPKVFLCLLISLRSSSKLNYKVSIELQGLSSTDSNFQVLSRPWIFILKFKGFFKVRTSPVHHVALS